MTRKLAVGLLAVALILPLAACGKSDDGKSGAKAEPKPSEQLAAAVTKTTGVSMKFVLAGENASDNGNGQYDKSTKIASISAQSDGEPVVFTVTADDLYFSGPKDLEGQTMHMLLAKLPAKHALAVMADPIVPLSLLPSATGVVTTTRGTYTGTIDLTKVTGATAGQKKFIEAAVAAAGAKANDLKFAAYVNADGYMFHFKATFPGLDEGKDLGYDVTFSDFGSAVSVAKPASKILEAPEEAYEV